MKSNVQSIARQAGFFFVMMSLAFSEHAFCQHPETAGKTIDVGVARVDITPETPILLAGYGSRVNEESDSVLQRLEAKALAIGSDAQHPSVLITVDLVGITERITSQVVETLSKEAGIDPAQIVICASHTHGGPEIGNLVNIELYREDVPAGYTDSLLPLIQLIHIAQYRETLTQKLKEVALAALKNRRPALLAWGQGQAYFAANRRTKGGPTDPSLPMLRVTNPDGTLRAVFVNYACHGTTLEGINEINGDWIVEAKHIIEANHPGAMALIALGCAADADPKPRSEMKYVKMHGQEISDNVDKLLASQLQPLTSPPVGKMKWIKLPFAKVPTVPELIETAQKGENLRGYYARSALDRIIRGETLPSYINYPLQVWNFGDKLAMVNLAGEVVVDYAIRLKNELGAEHLWVNGYCNDVPSYIASRRVIHEGGYEADFSMTCYDKPSPYVDGIEDMIVGAVHELMPRSFEEERDTVNHQELIRRSDDGTYHLIATYAAAIGPSIKYMREWKAFGWFNTTDRAEWNVNLDKAGAYDVYLKWSVSDDEAGKSFAVEAGNKKLKGKVGKTGSWFTYATKKIGTVRLPAGEQKMVFRSNSGSEKGPMLDLAEVVLVPSGSAYLDHSL